MKLNKLTKGAIALSVVSILAGGALAASAATDTAAATNTTQNSRSFNQEARPKPKALTDAQKAEMTAKQEAIKAALTASDYNAWVTAVKAWDANSPILKNVTADNFSAYVTKYNQREAEMAQQKTNRQAVQTALTAGDYNAWVTAVKAENADSHLLAKITSANFSQYVQANNLRSQAETIMKGLGIDGPGMSDSFGPGMGATFGHGGDELQK